MKTPLNNKTLSVTMKFIFMLIFVFVFSFFPAQKSEATVWPAVESIIQTALLTMKQAVMGMILGIAKQRAISQLSSQINGIVGGKSSSGAMFVTDWRDYLVAKPENEAKVYINSYVTQITAGRGSLSQYMPAGYEGFGSGMGNYFNSLKVGVMGSTGGQNAFRVTYSGDPSQMFAQGNFRNLDTYLSGINNPWAFNLHVQAKFDEAKKEAQLINAQKVQAGLGFIGKEVNGKTVTPGSVAQAAVTSVQDLGNKTIASATNIPEVLTSIVSKMLSQALEKGIGNVQAYVSKNTNDSKNKVNVQMNASIQKYGPAAQYMQKVQSSSSTNRN